MPPQSHADAIRQYGEGRCISCGFLCKQGFDNRQNNSRFMEVEPVPLVHREHGALFTLSDDYPSVPACFIGIADLHAEAAAEALRQGWEVAGPLPLAAIRSIISRDRHCEHWINWIEHWTPERHYEERRAMMLESEHRRWDDDLQRRRQEFEERLEQQRSAFEERMRLGELDIQRDIARNARLGRTWTAMSVVVATIAIVVGTVVNTQCSQPKVTITYSPVSPTTMTPVPSP